MARLVLIHGFTQTGRSWGGAVAWPGHDVVAPDVAPTGDLWATAEEVVAAGGPGTYIGYSMGGRLCLHAALRHPELVERLIVVGATGGLDDEGERADRRAADEQLARSIERDGVDAFLERWLAQPLFATLPAGRAGLDSRQSDPAVLTAQLRLLGTGTQEPLWDQLSQLAMPVLCMAGQLDQKFTALAHRLAAAIGANAEVALVAGAGHAAHLEQPEEFRRLVQRFLDAGGTH